jgi:DNA-binding NarL/FixJ family response regulator
MDQGRRRTRLVIVDDHAVVREGVTRFLERDGAFEVVAQLSTGDGAVDVIERSRADVALLDVSLPGSDGVEVAHALRRTAPSVRIVFLTLHEDDATLRAVLPVQPDGYLLKTEPVSRIEAAIVAALADRPLFSGTIGDRLRELAHARHHPAVGSAPRIRGLAEALCDLDRAPGVGLSLSPRQRAEMEALRRERPGTGARPAGFGALTAREKHVLLRIIEGLSAEAIARESFVSIATVRSQIRAVLSKLEVHSQLEAVALARRAGWPERFDDVLVLRHARPVEAANRSSRPERSGRR